MNFIANLHLCISLVLCLLISFISAWRIICPDRLNRKTKNIPQTDSVNGSSDIQRPMMADSGSALKISLSMILFSAFLILLSPFCPSGAQFFWVMMVLFLYAAFLQDFLTFYFDWKIWLWLQAGFLICGFLLFRPSILQAAAGIVPALLFIPFVLTKKMGLADLVLMAAFGMVLGIERAFICLLAGTLIGLILGIIQSLSSSAEKDIPFVSCLCLGFLIAWARGYSIYAFLMQIVLN